MALMSRLSQQRTIKPPSIGPSTAGIAPPGTTPILPPGSGYINPAPILPPPPTPRPNPQPIPGPGPAPGIVPGPIPAPGIGPTPGGLPPTLLPPTLTNGIQPGIGQGFLQPARPLWTLLDTSGGGKFNRSTGGFEGAPIQTGPGLGPGSEILPPGGRGILPPAGGPTNNFTPGTAAAQGFTAIKSGGLPTAKSLGDVYNLLPKSSRSQMSGGTHWTFGR